MPKIINKASYKKVAFGSEGYSDLSEFVEINAESGKKGEIGICDTNGSKRVRLSSNLYSTLEDSAYVKVLMSDTKIAFKSVPEGTSGAYEIGKGAVIYSTGLAEKIMAVASNVQFKDNATTRCGYIEKVQCDEDGSTTVILNFD